MIFKQGLHFPSDRVCQSSRQRNRTIGGTHMYMEKEGIYSKELAHIIMETDKSPDLQGEWAAPS